MPALCCLVALTILCGRCANLSAEAKEKSKGGGLSLTELFSSFSFNVDANSPKGRSAKQKDGAITLSQEELSALLNQFKSGGLPDLKAAQQGSFDPPQYDSDSSRKRHRGKPNRRKVLYDLSVRSHYERLLRRGQETNVTSNEEDDIDSLNCAYFNEGIDSLLNIREISKNENSVFSQFSYWTFKLCRQQFIRQLHLVPATVTPEGESNDAEDDVNLGEEFNNDAYVEGVQRIMLPDSSIFPSNIQFLQTSDLDLGTYLPQTTPGYHSIIKEGWGASERVYATTEYYIGGSKCTYKEPMGVEVSATVSKQRQSKVVIGEDCCERKESIMEEFFDQDEDIFITSVSEPNPCQYVFNACKHCIIDEAPESQPSNSLDIDTEIPPSVYPSDFNHLLQTYLHHIPSGHESYNPLGGANDPPEAFPPMPTSQIEANKALLQSMFTHAFDSYMFNAFPASELHPVTCHAGTFHLVRIPALTLIDSLDTLLILGNHTEFARSVERLRHLDEQMKTEFQLQSAGGKGEYKRGERGGLFGVNQNVSLFETTIRVLGGLLSAHQMAVAFMCNVVQTSDVFDNTGEILTGEVSSDDDKNTHEQTNIVDTTCQLPPADDDLSSQCDPSRCPPTVTDQCISDTEPAPPTKRKGKNSTLTDDALNYWKYDGVLLTLAHDLGKRLLHAFDTETGIPYGTVNLLRGVPKGETTVASLAGAGTLTLEFELLSRLTGDDSFGKAAKMATRELWMRRSSELNLMGKHIDSKSGKWTESLSGIGSNSDSFYEYLVKHYVLFPDDEDFWTMFVAVYSGIWSNSRLGDWYVDVDMNHGLNGNVRQIFESLMAFYPGLQILLGEVSPAAKTLNSFFLVREFLGLLPERFNFVHWKTEGSGDVHPLRPELLESW